MSLLRTTALSVVFLSALSCHAFADDAATHNVDKAGMDTAVKPG
ncbi:MAG: hypothetical protein WDN06_17340 [Asticcacaulis sp.]